ncbi:MAG: NAD-dependent epimerase/dehydratase family protein [Nitrosomonadales bacterium]|nr:NAD-dependent epimerase/dehydratase family protein [Nitrosomonadales bacterium]
MIVAITGGTGFIGRKLVLRHLERGDVVRVLSRQPPDTPAIWHGGDLAAPGNLQPFVDGADILYHCAAEIRDTGRMNAVHVKGTSRLIEAAAGRISRWIQLSSAGAYGKRHEGVITEETALNPCNTYERTKVLSDELVEAAASGGAFQHAILRPSNVYGAEMKTRSLFELIAMIRKGWFFFIGKPGASANYIHVNNVVEALVLCGSLPQAAGRTYNLSDYRTMEKFVAGIAGALDAPVPRMRVPEAPVYLLAKLAGNIPDIPLTESRVDALTSRSVYPVSRIERELGYRHIVTMEEGLTELVGSWKQKAGLV